MAPMVRRAPSGGGIGKTVHRKRVPNTGRPPSDSWDLFDKQDLDPDADIDALLNGHSDEMAVVDGPVEVEEAVDSLREISTRVGREVETFAERLDAFFSELPTATNRFDAGHDLVVEFKKITDDTVQELDTKYQREWRQQLRHEWSDQANISAASSTFKPFTTPALLGQKQADAVERLRQFQREADIWELFRVMLELRPFEDDKKLRHAENEAALAKMGTLHRYTSEGDIWKRFLIEDEVAHEQNLIKRWLEQTSDHQDSDVGSIVDELEAKAGRGKGLWSTGWMHTRERIKGEKRLRSWTTAVDSPLPQVKRSDNNDLLATTLDPDAPARESRTIEKPDAYFDRATWVAIWEMLRRGKTWQEICGWCDDRREGWRAMSVGNPLENAVDGFSSTAWRNVCFRASEAGVLSDYEAACFGLMGGNAKAVEKIARTLDDHLYAYYSSSLLQRFDQYLLSACSWKAPPPALRDNSFGDTRATQDQADQAVSDLISGLRNMPSLEKEAKQPMKLIECYLISDQVGALIHTVGAAVAEAAKRQVARMDLFQSSAGPPPSLKGFDELEIALNPQTLRIVAHMAIVFRVLSPDWLELGGDEMRQDENVLVAYIQALRAAGKRDLIPLYASTLQKETYVTVVGQVLSDVNDPREQKEILELLQQYDLDVVAILDEYLQSVLHTELGGDAVKKPLRILEPTDEKKLHPGQRIIVDFLPNQSSKEDEAVVRCLQWYQLLHGGWDVTFAALTAALRRCLVIGRFVCARMIIQEFEFVQVSMQKSYETIGRSVNCMDPSFSPEDPTETLRWEIMTRQARTYYELEYLVTAIECLQAWRAEEHIYVSKVPKPATVPSALKSCKTDVSDAMEPLLNGLLLHPLDDAEAADLKDIRVAYLPEVIIAYNTVLHAAGNLITRDSLLESMDLGVVLAQDDNGLAESFAQSGRMRELVSSLALTSKIMLVLKAEGKPWKPRKDRRGKDLGVWEIVGRGRDEDDDEEEEEE